MPRLDSEEDVSMTDAVELSSPLVNGEANSQVKSSKTTSDSHDASLKNADRNSSELPSPSAAIVGLDSKYQIVGRNDAQSEKSEAPLEDPLGQDKMVRSVEGNDTEARLAIDQSRLQQVLKEVSHKAAQNILRENWRTMLFDPPDESHVAFILRAGLKNSTSGILSRVIKDDNVFKQPFISAACQKPALRKRVLETATTQELLDHLDSDKLNALVGAAIKTVEAKKLVSWLAKANRLGFEEDDIHVGSEEVFAPNLPLPTATIPPPLQGPPPYRNESIPYPRPNSSAPPFIPPPNLPHHHQHAPHLPLPPPPAPPRAHQFDPSQSHVPPVSHILPIPPSLNVANNPQSPHLNTPFSVQRPKPPTNRSDSGVDALLVEQNKQRSLANSPGLRLGDDLICADCNFRFRNATGYEYHLTKKPCLKPPPQGGYKAICANCRQGFTTKQGIDYHQAKRVCLGEGDTFPTNSQVAAPPGYVVSGHFPQAPSDGLPRPAEMDSTLYSSGARPSSSAILPPKYGSPAEFSRLQKHNSSRPSDGAYHRALPPRATPGSSSTSRKQAPRAPDDVRVEPSQLPPERLAALNRELDDVDRKYEQSLRDIPVDWLEDRKENKRLSLKNANASRKSQIRKSYGVSLRLREKDRQFRDNARKSMQDSSPTIPQESRGPPSNLHWHISQSANDVNPLAGPVKTSGFSPVNAARAVPPILSQRAPSGQSGAYLHTSSNNSSGSSTPAFNPPLKRRHEELEHERRPAQEVYTGSMPRSSVLTFVGSLHAGPGEKTTSGASGPPPKSSPRSEPKATESADLQSSETDKAKTTIAGANVPGKKLVEDRINGGSKSDRAIITLDDSESDMESISAK